ncbi:MAG: DUF4465 domain-containing protein [Bacteroidales bacterium]|jgi:hypothetical protein|nr:DUF4465 domain-containing protein [Bacteroidales bacterium]
MKKVLLSTAVVALLIGGCRKDDDSAGEHVFTFEDVPADMLAGPTAYGENLYSTAARPYTGYTDAATSLTMGINEADGVPDFWNGGVAISRWNDIATEDYLNQCSVYYRDSETGYGGYGGSLTFAVAAVGTITGGPAEVFFADRSERQFSCVWVANTTYAALVMLKGNHYANPFSYENKDWLKLTVTAYKADGSESGHTTCYLADFRTADAGGLLTAWKKIDLSALGTANKLSFGLESSDAGEWGMNTPAYFCFDNLTFAEK